MLAAMRIISASEELGGIIEKLFFCADALRKLNNSNKKIIFFMNPLLIVVIEIILKDKRLNVIQPPSMFPSNEYHVMKRQS